MARSKLDLRGDTYRKVLGFTLREWRKQPQLVAALFLTFFLATIADVFTPPFAGQLVDAVSRGATGETLEAALWAFAVLIALGLFAVLSRQLAFIALIRFTLRMMSD